MENSNFAVFEKFFPKAAAAYAYRLWEHYDFYFVVSKPRKTKLGDYRYNPKKDQHKITVNGDLNPYSFLVTYIHEVAHMETFLRYKDQERVMPHGTQWKQAYQNLFRPVLTPEILPEEVYRAIEQHMQSPRASSHSDFHLLRILSTYNRSHNPEAFLFLDELPEGQHFSFQQRTFKKLYLRRTRVVCEEVPTQKRFLISKAAMVEQQPSGQ